MGHNLSEFSPKATDDDVGNHVADQEAPEVDFQPTSSPSEVNNEEEPG